MKINPNDLTVTIGVRMLQRKDDPEGDYLFAPALQREVQRVFFFQPNECTDGGNDKHFFSFDFRGTKLFAAENEVGGLTIMLPDEY